MARIALLANTDWYLYHYRSALLLALREQGHEVLLLSPPGEYVRHLKRAGFAWFPVPMTRAGMNPVQEAGTLLRCVRMYSRLRPDLCQHFTLKPILYGSLAARVTEIPAVVNSFTGLGYLFEGDSRGRRRARTMLRPLFRLATEPRSHLSVFQTSEDARVLRAWGFVRDAPDLIPGSGVDPHRFRPRPEPGGTPVVMLAARMLWDKGPGDLVEAAQILRRRGIEFRVVLVGRPDPGNPTSIPTAVLQRWHHEGAVEWWQHREDMPEVLAGAHVVALPTRYGEGVPRVLVEAAACGRPVVASDLPGNREIVYNQISGVLVPAGDVSALAEALDRLIRDPALRRRMGRQSRKIVLDRFTDERVNRQYLDLYRSLLESGAGRDPARRS